MITPELIEYIRGEFTKGRTREEVHAELIKNGGWSEADLSEAFRTVVPMQGFVAPNPATQNIMIAPIAKNRSKSKSFWQNSVFIIISLIFLVSWWFYRPQIISFWNSGINTLEELSVNSWNSSVNNLKKISMPSFNFGKIFSTDQIPNNFVVPQNNPIIKPTISVVKDCGIGTAPDLKNPFTYENNAVLNCLGNSALHCEEARVVLKNDLFPTVFQIVRDKNADQDICRFKLSYAEESALIDVTGKKLAGQYVTCPLSLVKELDETKTPPSFGVPNTSDLGKYAGQIYFYGTLGLFIENNVDQNRIQSLGCRGDYISSVIASYQKAQ